MNFAQLEGAYEPWRDLLVIGRTLEHTGIRACLLGMTLGEEGAKLYILEPCEEPERPRRPARTQRQIQRDNSERNSTFSYLFCEEVRIGTRRLRVQGASGDPLRYAADRPCWVIQLFYAMLRAGWVIPPWLKELDWDGLQLIALEFPGVKRLPSCTPDTPITLRHRARSVQQLLERPVTLTVGKPRAFSFPDRRGEDVRCYINQVSLIDVWKFTQARLQDPRFIQGLPPEELEQVKTGMVESVEQLCPRGMYFIGVEYECSRELDLLFYTREFLSSRPTPQNGGSGTFFMFLRSDRKTGSHGLPLKSRVLQTPVPPDTVKIPAELFAYYERTEPWEETV